MLEFTSRDVLCKRRYLIIKAHRKLRSRLNSDLQEYKFVVTARDGAPDYRLATATVTVKVVDVEDEIPVFHQSSYEARVKENMPDYTVIQVMVSWNLQIQEER